MDAMFEYAMRVVCKYDVCMYMRCMDGSVRIHVCISKHGMPWHVRNICVNGRMRMSVVYVCYVYAIFM